ncbi:MAG: FAD-dependent oxidoreductase [Victivallales bacterium]
MSISVKKTEEYDVIVAGAGPAGIGAALTAARNGAKTALIETHGCLGGVWTAGLLSWIFEADNPGVASEIAAELAMMGANNGPNRKTYSYDIESMKVLLERLCIVAGVKIRLFTGVVDAVVEERCLKGVITESKSGREQWPARCFIDCTGDGDLGAAAGNAFDLGGPNGEVQPGTLMGLIAVKDISLLKDYISFLEEKGMWEHHRICQENLLLDFSRFGYNPSYMQPSVFHVRDNVCAIMFNHQYKLSAIDADSLTDATISARSEIYRIVEGLRTLGGPWEGVTLVASAEQIGIREARRLHGLYTLCVDDLIAGTKFHDGVCTCSFCVDVHSPDPTKDKGLSHKGIKVHPYQIPYRALVAKDVNGLLMAGRCISGDWLSHASYRVTGTAVALGEAAGRAAAFCAVNKKLPHEVSWRDVSI